jgi:hypothetical protein
MPVMWHSERCEAGTARRIVSAAWPTPEGQECGEMTGPGPGGEFSPRVVGLVLVGLSGRTVI